MHVHMHTTTRKMTMLSNPNGAGTMPLHQASDTISFSGGGITSQLTSAEPFERTC
jgi:hypothetical protein